MIGICSFSLKPADNKVEVVDVLSSEITSDMQFKIFVMVPRNLCCN